MRACARAHVRARQKEESLRPDAEKGGLRRFAPTPAGMPLMSSQKDETAKEATFL